MLLGLHNLYAREGRGPFAMTIIVNQNIVCTTIRSFHMNGAACSLFHHVGRRAHGERINTGGSASARQ